MTTLDFMSRVLQREERAVPVAQCTPIIYRRCAWCSHWLGVMPTHPSTAGMTTDTICATCFARVRATYHKEAA